MKFTIMTLIAILMIGCSKEEKTETHSLIDCNKLVDSFITKDFDYAKSVIDSISHTLPPITTETDEIGHELNSINLVEKLNQSCEEINFELTCYACAKSLPPLSMVKVRIEMMDSTVERHFSLSAPEEEFMQSGM